MPLSISVWRESLSNRLHHTQLQSVLTCVRRKSNDTQRLRQARWPRGHAAHPGWHIDTVEYWMNNRPGTGRRYASMKRHPSNNSMKENNR